MRVLFVSGTMTGGSSLSTYGLAETLAARGHVVGVVSRRRKRPRAGLVQPATSGRTAVAGVPRRAARAARRVVRPVAGPPTPQHGVDVWTCDEPERVLEELCATVRPDVVVVGSIARNAWASMRATLIRLGVPSVLYVREQATLEHVPIADLLPALVLTNSEALCAAVGELGLEAWTVPSIIDFSQCAATPTGDVVLFVNPIESRGLSTALQLAAANPDIRFAFQRSWPLDTRDEHALQGLVRADDNVELRGYEEDPARIYRDARVLLLPYRVDQRPRVVAEAQWNGIPVLASDLPAHREAVGDGGIFVPLGAATDAWCAGLRTLWDDDDTARRVGAAARAHATRPDQEAGRVTARFEELVSALLTDHEHR